jgi:ankyrin repeat/BTB/POZ domain-containing protein 1
MDSTEKNKALFTYSRMGQLDKLRELVEDCDVNVNIKDKWDSSPLYYACVCGHEEVVDYLLRNGARCEANTFDGERCLYAALTHNIKETLKGFKAVTKDIIRRDRYLEFFRIALSSQSHKDICFIVHGTHIFAHRVILASRSSYFAQMLQNKWKNKRYIHLKHRLVVVQAFKLMIQYIYTDQIDIHIDEVPDLKRLCRQCHLVDLQDKLEQAVRKFNFYADSKPIDVREKMSLLTIQPDLNSRSSLSDSYVRLVEACIPYNLRVEQFPDSMPDLFFIELPELADGTSMYGDFVRKDEIPPYADICFVIDDNHFYGHKVFYCGRSDYFKSLESFCSVSSESAESDDAVVKISLKEISADVFALITAFIYTSEVNIPEDLLEEVLHFAALYMLQNLKKLCSNQLMNHLNSDNVLNTFKISRLYNLGLLEAACCDYMAQNLANIIDDEEFGELVLEDAKSIKDRQQNDSIPILDDIRFHLFKAELPNNSSLSSSMSDEGYFGSPDDSFRMLDQLLVNLGIDE